MQLIILNRKAIYLSLVYVCPISHESLSSESRPHSVPDILNVLSDWGTACESMLMNSAFFASTPLCSSVFTVHSLRSERTKRSDTIGLDLWPTLFSNKTINKRLLVHTFLVSALLRFRRAFQWNQQFFDNRFVFCSETMPY